MATVNKKSLREEVDSIQAEFERISAKKKIDNELHAVFKAMLVAVLNLNS